MPECNSSNNSSRSTPRVSAAQYRYKPCPASSCILANKAALRDEVLQSFGPYGREIATFSENGGNPDDLIDIFKEEQRVQGVDITTEDGQKEMVFQYLTKVVGRSAIKANSLSHLAEF